MLGLLDWGDEVGIAVATSAQGELGSVTEDERGNKLVTRGVRIPPTPDKGTLVLDAFKAGGVKLEIVFTSYGDASTPDGARARLHNLGFLHMKERDESALTGPIDGAVVDALNRVPGIRTYASCGGHARPFAWQMPAGTFNVSFETARTARGFAALERVADVVLESAPRAVLTAWAARRAGLPLAFELRGTTADGRAIAKALAPRRRR
jgi:hypothetical protein